MMIAGFIVTAGTAGHFLDPFSTERLILVTSIVAVAAFAVAVIAVHGIEPARGLRQVDGAAQGAASPAGSFRAALAEAWADPQARRFTVFVFVSMLAYSMQDLILEPFAGIVFGMTPGASTKLAGLQNAGVLLGMVVVGVFGTWRGKSTAAALRSWCLGGCVASALALFALLSGALDPQGWPLRANVFALGVANGAFAVAAIGSMMALAAGGRSGREGVRMGLWGASQAIAFALGGVLGTAAVDIAKLVTTDAAHAYGLVFGLEACVFLWAALLAGQRSPSAGATQERGRVAVVPAHLPYARGAAE
jgi:BCD family chlorophyll transporter-like MFS transporter